MGKLGVEGTANLYLINPNGIFFGNGAVLDIRGSFTATTADSIKLGENGLFSATNPQSSNLLTVQPGALFTNALRNYQAEIKNEGNLQVSQNLTFNADNLNLSGQLQVGGAINLNGRNQVTITNSLITSTNANDFGVIKIASFQDSTNTFLPQNIFINNSSLSTNNINSQFAGDFILNASKQIEINNSNISSQGNLGRIFIGKYQDLGEMSSPANIIINNSNLNTKNSGIIEANNEKIDAGDISIDALNKIDLLNKSRIETSTVRKGNAGNIIITTGSLSVKDDARILSRNDGGQGNAGSITITASDIVELAGTQKNGNATVGTDVANQGIGNGNNINIIARSVFITDEAIVAASIIKGKGENNLKAQAGNVNITAREEVAVNNNAVIFSEVGSESIGDGGSINIKAPTVSLNNAGSLITQIRKNGQGDGGDINISSNSLFVKNGSKLFAGTFGNGNAGNITITNSETVIFDGVGSNKWNSNDPSSGAYTSVEKGAEGKAGGVDISSKSLELLNGSRLSASTFGVGDAGTVKIIATDSVKFDGNSSVFSQVGSMAKGNAGGVDISAKSLELLGGAFLDASTLGEGDAGTIKITATDTVKFDGKSYTASQVSSAAKGKAGGVDISSKSLELLNGSYLSASTFSKGDAGTIKIIAADIVKFDRESIVTSQVGLEAEGKAGGVDISSKSLELLNGSYLSASTFGKGDAGTIKITAADTVKFDSKSIATSQVGLAAEGNAGGVDISSKSLELLNGSFFDASTLGKGNAGSIMFNADTVNISNGAKIAALTNTQGNSGSIIINAPKEININDNSQLTVETRNTGNAGDIKITTPQLNIQNSVDISASTSGSGKGGNIQIKANNFKAESAGKLTTTTSAAGQAGTINLKIQDSLHLTGEGTGIFANTEIGSTGAGGSIFIDPITMLIENGASIKVNSQGTGIAGNIKIEADNLTLNNQGSISAATVGGEGGNINLNVTRNIELKQNSLISAEAGNAGNGGNININSGKFILAVLSEDSDIVANAFAGKGGTVTGKAVGIFGFRQFVKERTPESDFIASSKLGIDGVISIETEQKTFPQLPRDFINAESLNKDVCAVKDDKIAGGSSFIITGKGGLPADTNELISNSPALVEWENNSEVVTQAHSSPVKVSQKNKNHHPEIQQAQGWIITPDGKVILTADAAKVTLQTDKNNLPNCK